MGWAFRRFGMSKGQQGAALLGLVLLAFAQILLAEFILGLFGFGVMPPSASLGSLVRDAMPHLRQAPHLLWSALPGAAGVMGLFTRATPCWMQRRGRSRSLVAFPAIWQEGGRLTWKW